MTDYPLDIVLNYAVETKRYVPEGSAPPPPPPPSEPPVESVVLVPHTVGLHFGDILGDGGLAALFNGNNSGDTNGGSSAYKAATTFGFAGSDYGNAPKRIHHAVLHGTSDVGLWHTGSPNFTLHLYGKNGAAPTSDTNGILLGTSAHVDANGIAATVTNTVDTLTLYRYVWVRPSTDTPRNLWAAQVNVFEIVLGAAPPVVVAVPKIDSPVNNRVFQQSAGSGSFRVTWHGPAPSTVRLARVSDSQVVAESTSGQFNSITPGWYKASLVVDGAEGDSINVGVGDVYVVAGQSNAVSPLQPANYVYPRPSAKGRVIVSDYYGLGSDFGQGNDPFIDAYDDILSSAKANIAWIQTGITLNRSYPVMFVNVARGNTSTADWLSTYFARLVDAWSAHKPKTILWHQGESDAIGGFSQAASFANMDAMVTNLRAVTITPWVVALNSRSVPYPPIRAAQAQLIAKWNAMSPPIVYQGPDTDPLRNGNDEFLGADISAHGAAWGSRLIALGL